jgi:exosome complex component RRP4
MKGVGLRRLNQGAVESIPVQHVDRIRGDGNSLLQRLRDACDCRIMVGENGRVWIDGDSEGIAWARKALQMVAEKGHTTEFEAILAEMEQQKKGDA